MLHITRRLRARPIHLSSSTNPLLSVNPCTVVVEDDRLSASLAALPAATLALNGIGGSSSTALFRSLRTTSGGGVHVTYGGMSKRPVTAGSTIARAHHTLRVDAAATSAPVEPSTQRAASSASSTAAPTDSTDSSRAPLAVQLRQTADLYLPVVLLIGGVLTILAAPLTVTAWLSGQLASMDGKLNAIDTKFSGQLTAIDTKFTGQLTAMDAKVTSLEKKTDDNFNRLFALLVKPQQ